MKWGVIKKMTTKKATRRALLTSVMALVMCLVMLVGTTFAWFTDSVTSGVNTIKSGNLDVELEYKNTKEGSFTKVDENTNVFKTGTLWEPGHVEYAVLRISNVGSLALKYQLGVKVASETTSTSVLGNELKLSNYLKFAVLNGDQCALDRDTMVETAENSGAQLLSTGYAKEDSINAGAEAKLVTLVVWMPTTVGNEANHDGTNVPSIDLGINLVAKQDTVEKDSFDNKYDENASYGDVALVTPGTQEDLNNAIKTPTNTAGESVKDVRVTLPADSNFTLDSGIAHEGNKSRNVTFVGDGSQTVDVVAKSVNASEGNEMNYQRGSSFAFQNVTVQGGTTPYGGIVCDEVTFTNCTISGKLTLYGKATFINCTFENDMADQYSIWTWGGTDVTFEGCKFNTNGKAILLYGQATAANPTNLTVNNCVFNDRNNGAAGKAAIEIGNDYNATYNLVVNNATVNGFADGKNTGSKVWANKNSMDVDHLSVTIDGTKAL